MKSILVLSLLFVSTPVWAQRIEIAPIVSYTTPATLQHTAAGVDELRINGAMTWGARGTYFLTEHLGLEALWTYQPTELTLSAPTGNADLFDMSLNQVFGNVAYEFGEARSRTRPFVFGGMGATFFKASDVDSETKFAWDIGAGVKWLMTGRFGVEGRVRYTPTDLHGSSAGTCGPFDFCQGTLRSVGITTAFLARF